MPDANSNITYKIIAVDPAGKALAGWPVYYSVPTFETETLMLGKSVPSWPLWISIRMVLDLKRL